MADANGTIYTVQGAAAIGSAGMGAIADLSYNAGGLWGFSNASDTLFYFDLFVLDLTGAAANLVGTMSHADAFSYIADIEFTGSGSLLAMTWYHRDFYTVNPGDASTTFVSAGPHRDVTGLAVDPPQFPPEPVPEAGTLAGGGALLPLSLGGLLRSRR